VAFETATVSAEDLLSISFHCILDPTTEDDLADTTLESILSPENVASEKIVTTDEPFRSILHDIQNYMYMYDPEIEFGLSQVVGNPNETLPASACVKNLVIKRGSAFTDVMKFFLKEKLNLRTELSILTERGDDSGDVFRDDMSEFWGTYLKHTEGADVKIPTTVHIIKQKEWEAVAKPLVLCFKQEKYLPVQLSRMFLYKCIFDTAPSNEELLGSFLGFLPEMDRGLIKDALENFDGVDEIEILDAFLNFNLRVYSSKDNFRKLVIELAHHELIQKTSFVTLCWFPIVSCHLKPLIDKLGDTYEQSKVINRKNLNLHVFPKDMSKVLKL
jgi:hypothetical protein